MATSKNIRIKIYLYANFVEIKQSQDTVRIVKSIGLLGIYL